MDGKELYVNMNGGLKADGNPLGATGGAQIFEIFRQLRGEAGERQVKVAEGAPKYGGILSLKALALKPMLPF